MKNLVVKSVYSNLIPKAFERKQVGFREAWRELPVGARQSWKEVEYISLAAF